jgi:YebC/PmpR family DNA-binding regulatory protein
LENDKVKMSGHSKWAQIKYKKEVTDKKRGQLFSKLLKAIRAAARTEPNPDFNPRLRTAIEAAKAANVPMDNIRHAIEGLENKNTEEIIVEGYGPSGVAFLVSAVTDNRNRTIAELRKIFGDHEGKVAEPGSVLWAFEQNKNGSFTPKFPTKIDPNTKEKVLALAEDLNKDDDVVAVFTNTT